MTRLTLEFKGPENRVAKLVGVMGYAINIAALDAVDNTVKVGGGEVCLSASGPTEMDVHAAASRVILAIDEDIKVSEEEHGGLKIEMTLAQ